MTQKSQLGELNDVDDGGSIFWIFFGLQTSIYRPDLIILGEYNPDAETHRATDTDLAASWISTETIREFDIVQAHGLWVAPGSPNKNLERALEAIRLAREHLVPCLGTCGGFSALKLAQQSSSGPRQDGSSEPGCSRDQEQFAWSYRAAFRSLLRALVQYFALGPRVPGARIAECRNSGQKSQDRARLKKYRSWLGLKTRNQGCYWCAKLSANLGDPLLLDQHPIQQPESFHPWCRAATDYEVKLHGEFSFKFDLPVG